MDCARRGYNRGGLKGSFELAKRRPLTSGRVEDLHGASSCVMRSHPLFTLASCKARSMLSYSRVIVCPQTDMVRLRLERKVAAAMERMPNKINAKCMFLQECIDLTIVNLSEPSKSQKREAVKDVVKAHGTEYAALQPADLEYYRDLATKKRLLVHAEVQDQLAEHKANLDLYVAREESRRQQDGQILRSSNFTFGPNELARLQYIMEGGSITQSKIQEREAHMNRFKIPQCSESLLEDLDNVRIKKLAAVPQAGGVSEWIHEVCRRVNSFRGTILEFRYPDGTILYYAVMIPFGGPHVMCLQPLQRLPSRLHYHGS